MKPSPTESTTRSRLWRTLAPMPENVTLSALLKMLLAEGTEVNETGKSEKPGCTGSGLVFGVRPTSTFSTSPFVSAVQGNTNSRAMLLVTEFAPLVTTMEKVALDNPICTFVRSKVEV